MRHFRVLATQALSLERASAERPAETHDWRSEQSGSLQVVEVRNALQEAVVLDALVPELMVDDVMVAERGSQHGEALALGGEGPITNPNRLDAASEVGDCWQVLPGGIPDATFALVEADSRTEGIVEGAARYMF